MPNTVPLNPVKSSNIAATGYDPETKTLAVQFRSGKGATYHYADVPEQVYKEMCDAQSVGSYLNKNVVGKYVHTKIDPPQEEKAEGADAAA